MEDVSVSKGAFPKVVRTFGKKRTAAQTKEKYNNDNYRDQPWYQSFNRTWLAIEDAANEINTNAFQQILSDMESFVTKVKTLPLLPDEIPTGILLAGVNIPDHGILLQKLIEKLEYVTPYIATVWSRDANTLKHLNEEMIYQILNNIEDNESDDVTEIKKSQCTFYKLQAWHEENNNGDTPVVVIIPDFEGFSPKILHDFILILSSYSKTIKFVLIFGVATTLHIVHRSLSYDATSKLKIQVFQTQTQFQSLSDVFNGILLSPKVPFKLIGKAFKFLVDSFLYYDFSVKGFLQSYKICVWRHFYQQNEKLICCSKDEIDHFLPLLTEEDIYYLKKLQSVKNYFDEPKKTKISNAQFKQLLPDLVYEFHDCMNDFLIILKCLFNLTISLPNNPFGKNFREIYATAVGNVSIFEMDQYRNAMKLVGFLSKEELIASIKSMLKILNNHELASIEVIDKLKEHMSIIKGASLDVIENSAPEVDFSTKTNRLKLLQTLKQQAQTHSCSPYKKALIDFVEYLDKKVFQYYLITPKQRPMYEIFCYDDSNDASAVTVRDHIKGSMKATIHIALSDPHYYFGCDCCDSDLKLLSTHPDQSIVFKLYTEAGKMINVYDWLQSFLVTINPNESDEHDEQDVDPALQARFTRAIAELQFLGFIKITRKKADHVKKLT